MPTADASAKKGSAFVTAKVRVAEDRAAEMLGGGLGAAQDPVRMGERVWFDQLGHGRLRGRVVDGARPPVDEHEGDEQRAE